MVLIPTCPSMVCRDHQYSWWFQSNKTEFIQYWSQFHKVAEWTPSLFRSPQLDPTRLQVLAYHSLWKMFFIKENTANGWIQIFQRPQKPVPLSEGQDPHERQSSTELLLAPHCLVQAMFPCPDDVFTPCSNYASTWPNLYYLIIVPLSLFLLYFNQLIARILLILEPKKSSCWVKAPTWYWR